MSVDGIDHNEYNIQQDMDNDCIFCKIVAGSVPANKQYEDEELLAFDDIAHEAPVHVVVIPKQHVNDLQEADSAMVGRLQTTLPKIAVKLGLGSDYQVNLNAGKYREVPHLHYHLKGGMK